MNLDALKNIFNLNVDDKNKIKHVGDIYLGTECNKFLETLSLE